MRLKIIVVFFRFEIQKQFLDKLPLAARLGDSANLTISPLLNRTVLGELTTTR